MKKRLSTFFASIGIIAGFAIPLAVANSAFAVDVFQGCQGTQGAGSSSICPKVKDEKAVPILKNVINLMIFVAGIIAVIMIVVGGIRYVVSNGESAQIKAAKDTVLYSVIGLILAILSYGIVNFVLQQF